MYGTFVPGPDVSHNQDSAYPETFAEPNLSGLWFVEFVHVEDRRAIDGYSSTST